MLTERRVNDLVEFSSNVIQKTFYVDMTMIVIKLSNMHNGYITI